MYEPRPEWDRKSKSLGVRLTADEMQKLELLCDAANRGYSTLIRYLINDAYHRAVMKGKVLAAKS